MGVGIHEQGAGGVQPKLRQGPQAPPGVHPPGVQWRLASHALLHTSRNVISASVQLQDIRPKGPAESIGPPPRQLSARTAALSHSWELMVAPPHNK
jgi:hypothetical protein